MGAIGAPGQRRDLADWPSPDVRAEPWHPGGDGTLTTSPGDGEAVSPATAIRLVPVDISIGRAVLSLPVTPR